MTAQSNVENELRFTHCRCRSTVKRVARMVPERLFELDKSGLIPGTWRLARRIRALLNVELPQLAFSGEIMRTFLGKDAAASLVEEYANAQASSDRVRSNILWMANRGAEALGLIISDTKRRREVEAQLRDLKHSTDYVLALREGGVCQASSIPNGTLLVLCIVGLIAVFLCEIKNAMFLVLNAGLGFDGDNMGAFCFALPAVAGPVLALKFIEYSLPSGERPRFMKVLSIIAGAVALVAMGLFSVTLGMMHSDADVFDGHTKSWTPPLWLLLGTMMLLLALMGTMLTSFLSNFLGRFFYPKPVDNLQFVDLAKKVLSLDQAIVELEFIRGQLLSVIKQLQGERVVFIKRCLAELKHLQAALAAKHAHIDSSSLNE